ncbi:50S ribosome-binding GTPase [Candidatus Woesearchaeota archaeon]|nr:50S ribosome-binding GTPase [Candidatus Woesearchaeota archaeon]
MNFQKTQPVEKGSFYLDVAVQRAKKQVNALTIRIKDEDKKALIKEKTRIKVIKDTLIKSFINIINSFPGLDGLPEFYYELCKSTMDVDEVKKALSVISWAPGKISELEREFIRQTRGKTKEDIIKARRAFIGRISSIIKRMDKKLELIEQTRRTMITYPDIKDDLFTVCISGFPNVGKSTLLSRITTSKPEIGNYSFTTTTLNTGYFKDGFEKIQIIDVPGTLNRFEKMNNVEKQAHLALKYLANLIVYVYDLTEPYSLKEQDALFEETKKLGKPILIYVSKADLLGKQKIKEFIKNNEIKNANYDSEELRKEITKQRRK